MRGESRECAQPGETFGGLALDRADRTAEGRCGGSLVEIEIVAKDDRGTLPARKFGQGAAQPMIAVVDCVHVVDSGVVRERAVRHLAVPLAPAPADRGVNHGRANVRKRVTAGRHRLPPLGNLDQRDLHDILRGARVAHHQVGAAHQCFAVGDDEEVEGLERSHDNSVLVADTAVVGTITRVQAIGFTIGNEHDPPLSPAIGHGHGSQVRIH